MKTHKKTATLIVNWNKKKYVLALLHTLKKNMNDDSFDIFVVDNASTDGSVEAICNTFPDVNLIVNQTNMGGTGGFNSGLKQILQNTFYKYIWLLDNDAQVIPTTLNEMVKAMDKDASIGLAGSRIQDIENTDIIVETGANFRWDTIGVIPVHRNSVNSPTEIIAVDYVAICSALVRVSAIKKVGLMDERMFLCWDDMDWGLKFKQSGYKVAAVTKSIAYHGSFTERERGDCVNYYYGVRNAFLTYAKHAPFFKRRNVFLNSLRFYLKTYYFFILNNKPYPALLIRAAMFDFLFNRWGRCRVLPYIALPGKEKIFSIKNKTKAKILVSLTGTGYENSVKMLNRISQLNPGTKIFILINSDRQNYFRNYEKIIIDGKLTGNIFYLGQIFKKLWKEQFDFVVTLIPTPFMYSAGTFLLYDEKKNSFLIQKSGLICLFKLMAATLLGELSAFLLFPFFLDKSFKYKDGNG